MPDTIRNMLMAPRIGVTFTFRSSDGEQYEIEILDITEETVLFRYTQTDKHVELSLGAWRTQVLDKKKVVEITSITY